MRSAHGDLTVGPVGTRRASREVLHLEPDGDGTARHDTRAATATGHVGAGRRPAPAVVAAADDVIVVGRCPHGRFDGLLPAERRSSHVAECEGHERVGVVCLLGLESHTGRHGLVGHMDGSGAHGGVESGAVLWGEGAGEPELPVRAGPKAEEPPTVDRSLRSAVAQAPRRRHLTGTRVNSPTGSSAAAWSSSASASGAAEAAAETTRASRADSRPARTASAVAGSSLSCSAARSVESAVGTEERVASASQPAADRWPWASQSVPATARAATSSVRPAPSASSATAMSRTSDARSSLRAAGSIPATHARAAASTCLPSSTMRGSLAPGCDTGPRRQDVEPGVRPQSPSSFKASISCLSRPYWIRSKRKATRGRSVWSWLERSGASGFVGRMVPDAMMSAKR